MSWTIKIKHTRPNTDVEFYDSRREYRATENTSLDVSDQDHINSTIAVAAAQEASGELVSSSTSLSENELELTKTFVYKDEPSRDAFIDDADAQAWFFARSTYYIENNINMDILQNEAT
jgi:hypothetical protein